ncbi:RNA polymerase sigma-70 factor, ECF subfamily [Micromonospora sediminicola]|uniref:RNA polymerase sigma-70 factor, ECF subfamily n=1 Tax=Micromonospora sediminicola TaxID=946078 RepID=A0A1A9B5E7_9ACTN|nr:RNA polymerase sigma-70 factor, ECF subfamily [Micromonospora sediminicola]
MTAQVAAPTRVPGQPGPPAVEQLPEQGGTWHLVVSAQAGDRDAFGQLYLRYYDVVYRFVLFRVGQHRQTAEDLAGETFVRALRRINTVQWQGRDIGAWFVTIARNLIADHFKSSRSRLECMVGDVLDANLGVDFTDRTREGNPADTAVDRQIAEIVREAMGKLTAEQQECLDLRFFQGLSVLEVAAAMGKQEGAVKALQYRAVRALAQRLPAGFEQVIRC